MLTLSRDPRRPRLLLVLGAVAVFLVICLINLSHQRPSSSSSSSSSSSFGHHSGHRPWPSTGDVIRPADSGSPFIGFYGEITGFAPPTTQRPGGFHSLHTELQSVSTRDRKFFRIALGTAAVAVRYPNILPHPSLADTWIVVAQCPGAGGGDSVRMSVELVCNARFIKDTLTCVDVDHVEVDDDGEGRAKGVEPTELPIEPTIGGPANCPGEVALFSLNIGPRDARVFYGPHSPLILYGSNSHYTCFGQWIQDFRSLVPDFRSTTVNNSTNENDERQKTLDDGSDALFTTGTELRRPPPHQLIEQNWFLFWDAAGAAYIHTDLMPRRTFARLHTDGSAGASNHKTARHSAGLDERCLARHLPNADVAQATNSLAVTLCRRADADCVPDAGNTFVFVVVQHHTVFEGGHAAYHPYVVVFRQRAPFEVWAVSRRPIWILGRGTLPSGDTEAFSVSSISWRDKGQRYHGYVDDVVFLAFGIEDREGAAIDVLAGDLLADLALC